MFIYFVQFCPNNPIVASLGLRGKSLVNLIKDKQLEVKGQTIYMEWFRVNLKNQKILRVGFRCFNFLFLQKKLYSVS